MANVRALCRKPAVCIAMGWGNSTLYQRIQEGLFVAPIKLGIRASAWPSDEIYALQNAYVAGLSEEKIRGLVTSLMTARRGLELGAGSNAVHLTITGVQF